MNKRRMSDSEETSLLEDKKMDAKEHDALLGVKRTGIPYPKSVFFIFITEFCERFSYYGMRTVLTLYLRNALGYPDNTATVIFHVFVMLCYTTPLFGAHIADSILGKFRTIFYLSIIYAIGNVTLSLASIQDFFLPAIPFSLLGLGLIALGTGGIKPCVSAFGGDQFQIPGQEKSLEQFFFIFYFTVNAGSVISTFLTPIFRKDISCSDAGTCYPLAFGVPAALMITALVIFVCGKPYYKIRMPEKNVGIDIAKCVWRAITNRKPGGVGKDDHWLDSASDKYDKGFIEDVKQLLSIFVLFIPLPIFWSLFDQQGSQWTLQATRMNGYVFNWWTIKPDQMQLVNSLLVIVLIPIFEMFIYPMLGKCNILKRPLQRMTLGGLLASLAFVIAAVVELQIQPTYPVIPGRYESNLNLMNTLPCPLNVSLVGIDGGSHPTETVLSLSNLEFKALPAINYSVSIGPFDPSQRCLLNGQPISYGQLLLTPQSQQSMSILIKANANNELEFVYSDVGDDLRKSQEGNAKIRVIHTGLPLGQYIYINLESSSYNYKFNIDPASEATETIEVEPGGYLVRLNQIWENGTLVKAIPLTEIYPETGGSYILALFPQTLNEFGNSSSTVDKTMVLESFVITNPSSINMLLLLPQYIVITFAEVLFAVTGYDFSFSQAPNSMKTVMQSVWLLTNAFGNLIVILVVESNVFASQTLQFFFFAGLMFVSFIAFVILADRYKSIELQPSTPAPTRRKSTAASMHDFLMIE